MLGNGWISCRYLDSAVRRHNVGNVGQSPEEEWRALAGFCSSEPGGSAMAESRRKVRASATTQSGGENWRHLNGRTKGFPSLWVGLTVATRLAAIRRD